MIPVNYEVWLQKIIRKYFPKNKVFIFGSSLRCENFRDIDVGILDQVNNKKIQNLKEELEKSTFPFFVDLVDFNQVENEFYDSVVNHQEIKWI
jgi:predicted nucleotidyltransferase